MSIAKQYATATATAAAAKGPMTKSSSFAQTCNQLSVFLKEKGTLRDLHLGINAKFDDREKSPTTMTTVDFLSSMENTQTEKSMDVLPRNDTTEKASRSESKGAQMTIFYDGRVIVFDDIPADRARDVMLAAGSCTPPRVELASTSNHCADVRGPSQPIEMQFQANGLDLPIARRASLHKFLEKRRDRATVRAPYQLHNPSAAGGSSKNAHDFDLNL